MVQVSFNVSTMADYQQMVVTGHTSVTTLPEAIKTFIINVSLDNRVKYNDIPSSVFGNNATCLSIIIIITVYQVFLDQLLISIHQLTTVLISI